MPQLVQDEKGNLFVDTGGGVYHPVNEDQAKAFQANPGMMENAFAAAGQGTENLITGAGSLLSGGGDYWQQANQAGRAQSEALALAQPVTAPAAQYTPQALLGAGAGSVPAAAITEGLLGAMTTPEAPVQGAALGALLGGVGAAIPGAVSATYRAGRNKVDDLGWFGQGSKLADDLPPGYSRPGDAGALTEQGAEAVAPGIPQPGQGAAVPPPAAAPASPFSNLADDMSGAPLQARPGAAATDAVGDLPLSQPPQRMAERVTSKLNEFGEGDTDMLRNLQGPQRVMGGHLTPEGLDAMRIPTTPGQRELLNATSPQQAARAREMLSREAQDMSDPDNLLGNRARAARAAQIESATNYLGRELGLDPGIALTDDTMAEVFDTVGKRLDGIADEMGSVPMSDELKTSLNKVMEQVTGSHRGQLQALSDELVKMAELNGGELSGKQWGIVRTKLNDMVDAGMRQGSIGKVSDANELMKVMVNNLEGNLPDATKTELRKLRRQYAIASNLARPGARNADGMVNPVSFYGGWKRGQSKKLMGKDDIGAFMNTIVTLTKTREPDSGTAGRMLKALAGKSIESVPVFGPGLRQAARYIGL